MLMSLSARSTYHMGHVVCFIVPKQHKAAYERDFERVSRFPRTAQPGNRAVLHSPTRVNRRTAILQGGTRRMARERGKHVADRWKA